MNLPTTAEGTPILKDYSRLNELIQRRAYTAVAKREMLEIMGRHPGFSGRILPADARRHGAIR